MEPKMKISTYLGATAGLAIAALTTTGAAAQTVITEPLYGPAPYGPAPYGAPSYGPAAWYGPGYGTNSWYGYGPRQTYMVPAAAPMVQTIQAVQPAPVAEEIVTTRRISGNRVTRTTVVTRAVPAPTRRLVTEEIVTAPGYGTAVYANSPYNPAAYSTVVPVGGPVPGTAVWSTNGGPLVEQDSGYAAPGITTISAPVATRTAVITQAPVTTQRVYAAPVSTLVQANGRSYRYVYLADRVVVYDALSNALVATYAR